MKRSTPTYNHYSHYHLWDDDHHKLIYWLSALSYLTKVKQAGYYILNCRFDDTAFYRRRMQVHHMHEEVNSVILLKTGSGVLLHIRDLAG